MAESLNRILYYSWINCSAASPPKSNYTHTSPCIPDLDMNDTQSCHSFEENMPGDNTTLGDAYIFNWARTAAAATMRDGGWDTTPPK